MKAYLLLIILILATIWSDLLNNQYEAWSASTTNPILTFILYYVTQTMLRTCPLSLCVHDLQAE